MPEGAQVEFDLRMESVMEGVLVGGTVTAPLTGECSRCLGDVSAEITVEIQELYAYPDSTTSETTTISSMSVPESVSMDRSMRSLRS